MSEQNNRIQKLKSGTNALLMIAGITGVLVAINWVGHTGYGRMDMTEGEVNSLSESSEKAVESMEGLEMHLYLSKRLPKSLAGPGINIENTHNRPSCQ